MNEPAGKIGLNIFGSITASISHEIKNRMAVINEHAGLMEDHIHMAERGGDINIERIMRSAGKIKQQIALADEIIANMNRFAHSIDKASQQISLHDAATLASALFQRTATAHEVTLEARTPQLPVTVETSMFHLLALIWICLTSALPIAPAKSTVTFACEKINDEPRLIIEIDTTADKKLDEKMLDTAKVIANEIKAEVNLDANQNNIVVTFI